MDFATKTFVTKRWMDVMVGDIIIVNKDEYFPADLLFLSGQRARPSTTPPPCHPPQPQQPATKPRTRSHDAMPAQPQQPATKPRTRPLHPRCSRDL